MYVPCNHWLFVSYLHDVTEVTNGHAVYSAGWRGGSRPRLDDGLRDAFEESISDFECSVYIEWRYRSCSVRDRNVGILEDERDMTSNP